ncbi:MAG: RNA methyltransferase [Acidobacteriota bacterium]|nr:RNA methyltransferase [Acidobacteriota bacterium]
MGESSFRSVRFVLVGPEYGGNVGAAARALKNLGFSRMHVVAPRCDLDGDEARRMAMDARDVLGAAAVDPDLDVALAGARTVIGTTRRTGKHRQPHWRLDRLVLEMARLADVGDLAVVFGREKHGLSDDEIDRCTHLVYFPSSEAYPSFNLAQAVLLTAYELRLALLDDSDAGEAPELPADHGARESMYAHLQAALEVIGFLHDDTTEPMMRQLRRMLGKASMTEAEVGIVRGIARQVLWLASEAGLHVPETVKGKGWGGGSR